MNNTQFPPLTECIKQLQEHDRKYAQGCPTGTDAEYDAFKYNVKNHYGDNDPYFKTVGTPVEDSPWTVVRHRTLMGSITNIASDPEDFANSVTQNTEKWLDTKQCIVQHKLDGLSTCLTYYQHTLSAAVLRGDGYEGEDILRNVLKMKNVKTSLPVKELRGEILLSKKSLQEINEQLEKEGTKLYKNCRNAAAGIARRLDGRFSEHLVILYYAVKSEQEYTTDSDSLLELDKYNLHYVDTKVVHNADFITQYYTDMIEQRATLPFVIDGLVIKDNIVENRTDTSVKPDWVRAMKFPPEQQPFVVDKIIWEVGKTGHVTPVAVNEQGVMFNDKVVNNVTLHNHAKFLEYNISVKDTISVVIAGDVIPKIDKVVVRNNCPIHAPTHCPDCTQPLTVIDKFLHCTNKQCSGIQKALINAHIKIMGIEDFGPETVQSLFSLNPANVKFSNIADIYSLSVDNFKKVDGIEDKTATKLYTNIQQAKQVSLPKFIASLGIPKIGHRIVEKIPVTTLEELLAISDFSQYKGIAKKTSDTIVIGLEDNNDLIANLLENGVTIIVPEKEELLSTKLKDLSFCFTGDIANINSETNSPYTRKEFQKLVVQHGGINKSGVSKVLNYLVIDNTDSTTSKAVKAKSYGTILISPTDFLNMFKD